MTGVGTQLGLLLWKNWLLQKRKVLVTVFEIALPLLFAAFLLLMRSYVPYNDYPEPTIYDPFPVTRFSRTLLPPSTSRNSTPPLYWKIAFSPNTSLTRDIANRMVDNLQPLAVIRVSSGMLIVSIVFWLTISQLSTSRKENHLPKKKKKRQKTQSISSRDLQMFCIFQKVISCKYPVQTMFSVLCFYVLFHGTFIVRRSILNNMFRHVSPRGRLRTVLLDFKRSEAQYWRTVYGLIG